MPQAGLLVNLEIERKLLALAATHTEAALSVQKGGGYELFKGRMHKNIYAAIEALLLSSNFIERNLVRDQVDSRRGRNAHYFEELIREHESLPLADTETYIRILADYSERRRLAELSTNFTNAIFNLGSDLRATKAIITQEMEATGSCIATADSSSLYDDMPDISRALAAYKSADTRITFPWPQVSQLTGPLKPGDFVIVAARPSMGKTTFALNVASSISRMGPVLFFSLEMSREQIALKALASELGKTYDEVQTPEALAWMAAPTGKMAKLFQNLFIFDSNAGSIDSVRATVFDFIRSGRNPACIVVDYIQLMGHGAVRGMKDESREREISLVSRGLKLLAKEAKCPVLALSQLNRRVEERANKNPVLSDLRDSGSLEQDADLVAFLFREEYYKKDSVPGLTDVNVLKNRLGPVGSAQIYLEADKSRFVGGK